MLTYGSIRTYSKRFAADDDGVPITGNSAGEELVERVNAYVQQHPEVSWDKALEIVSASGEGRALLNSYNTSNRPRYGAEPAKAREFAEHRGPSQDNDDGTMPVDQIIHERATELMAQGKFESYTAAVEMVLGSDEKLRIAYARFTGGVN